MKIVLCGGGSGGHFYPLIAVGESLRDLIKEKKLLQAKIYYLASAPYNKGMLFDLEIEYIHINAGKNRRYFSISNFLDTLKTIIGFIQALITIYRIYPDVIFSKGGMMSMPVVLAGKILGIPIVIHESDSVPGRANVWAGKFARKIALSYAEASGYFDESKVAYTGNPIRKAVLKPLYEGAREYLKLSESLPVLFVMGGSLGAKVINDTILSALPELVKKYEIIHQVGVNNYTEVLNTSKVVLEKSPFKDHYHAFDYMNSLSVSMAYGVATLVISRGGSTIFEIAAAGVPSIIIPITDSNGDHQRKNSYNYARSGGALVIEENNLTPEILLSEIEIIASNPDKLARMKKGALSFAKTDAAYKIASEIVEIALTHE